LLINYLNLELILVGLFKILIMKKLLLSILLLFIFTDDCFSQSFCESPSYPPHKDFIIDNGRHPDYSNNSFCVTLYIHVIRRSDGTGGQSTANVNAAMTYLNDAFNPYFIFFKRKGPINYINNTTLFNSPSGIMNITTYDHTDGVDLYLFDDTTNHPITGGGYGMTEGVGLSPKLMVTGNYFGDPAYPLVRSFVLAHEMGHVFNLWHTRHGTVFESGDPNQCPELVNGSNGWICGDYILDTPADPDIAFNIDLNTCEWTGSGVDANGDPYDPDELNILAYTHPGCMEYFTPYQSRRMKTALAMLPFLQEVSAIATAPNNPCNSITSPLNFYPNAASDELNLDLTNKPAGLYVYKLYDSNGIVVIVGESPNALETIDTSNLEEGVYYLHFYEGETLTIKQIFIDHQ
jgi:hypothetical protein